MLSVSSQQTLPQPATPVLYLNTLEAIKRPAFVARHGLIGALQVTAQTGLTGLIAEVEALLPLNAFDVAEFSLEDSRSTIVRFAEDTVRVVGAVRADLDRRIARSATCFADDATAATPVAQLAQLEGAAKA